MGGGGRERNIRDGGGEGEREGEGESNPRSFPEHSGQVNRSEV